MENKAPRFDSFVTIWLPVYHRVGTGNWGEPIEIGAKPALKRGQEAETNKSVKNMNDTKNAKKHLKCVYLYVID